MNLTVHNMIFESIRPEVAVTKPLFPLPLVLFPGGRLPLQIFEARYLDMVGECMREGGNFVVTMSRAEGFADLGCEVSIRDFDQLSNGLLGILAVGERKQQLFNPRQREDGLWLADAADITMESSVEVPADHLGLVELLKSLQVHPAVRGLYGDIDYTDATEVSARLTELLPLDNEVKQSFFEISDPLVRLIELEAEVTKLQIRGRDA
jgi:Lon protease-like protein